ncbi:SDR family NAD(P)-dependent oxidoreductase [Psychrobacillus soli]|uniref:SDR family NAD(P)-dependent oxidoreductase n=1 Tax=Psychrobacillus soli TaxID=1543965 RepID=A0A544TM36_9BACI|nr:SDR family NAD(P)-dependent oxidoreductase [Psychrobacillus soli]TQR18522.1 SDR family NAD(P)-dependent oxidoreductase [Psychrobacillus soli]
MNIQGKTAIVTGGASGLGLATVEQLIQKGANVAVLDRDIKNFHDIQERLGKDNLETIETDVTNEESVKYAVNLAYQRFGSIDICVNCAGIAIGVKTYGSKGVFPLEYYKKVIDVNLVGTFNVLSRAVEQMVKNEREDSQERGVIVNTSSGAAYDGQMGQAAYSASKAGIAGMTLPIARDLSNYGIRINAIAPGLFKTPMAGGITEDILEGIKAQMEYPKRLGEASEFASLVVHMIENTYLNGEVIRLDGATRLPPR